MESEENQESYEIVELHPAYFWDCPECGRENFQRTITRFFPCPDCEGDKAHAVPFVTYPETVECHHCGEIYVPTDPNEDYGEDEEEE